LWRWARGTDAMFPTDAYPDFQTLTEGLQSILQPGGFYHPVAVLDRRPNRWGGTFPAEIVTCRVDGRSDLQLFCKYETGASAGSHGHRGGVRYEGQVYRELLQPLSLTVPRFYGSYEDERRGRLWFVLEYLDDSLPVSKAREPDAMVRAAEWIGAFHRMMENRVRSGALSFLLRYDAEYYRGWAERTVRLSRGHDFDREWLPAFCRRFEEAADLLLPGPLTMVHGEYYPQNIGCQAGVIRPIDWESAAVGAGEIDLASLTDNWPNDITRECERAYSCSRWANGSPPEFAQRLDLARLYLQLRWLGSPTGWRTRKETARRFEQIRRIAERQALL
jgi:aminoglycoside phosphotransferase (APT) family kinase protein